MWRVLISIVMMCGGLYIINRYAGMQRPAVLFTWFTVIYPSWLLLYWWPVLRSVIGGYLDDRVRDVAENLGHSVRTARNRSIRDRDAEMGRVARRRGVWLENVERLENDRSLCRDDAVGAAADTDTRTRVHSPVRSLAHAYQQPRRTKKTRQKMKRTL